MCDCGARIGHHGDDLLLIKHCVCKNEWAYTRMIDGVPSDEWRTFDGHGDFLAKMSSAELYDHEQT